MKLQIVVFSDNELQIINDQQKNVKVTGFSYLLYLTWMFYDYF